jgi:hypothetical protein
MGNQQTQFPLDMTAEVQQRSSPEKPLDAQSSTEIAAKIDELMRQRGIEPESNPMAAEKIQRDLEYQRQMETFAQPDSAPPTQVTPELDRLDSLQKELEAAKAEATRWKKEFGRREGKVGGMESRIKELEARVSQVQPVIDVRQMTGKDPNEPLTANDVVGLLIAQSGAFGNAMKQLRDELVAQASNSTEPGLPLDLEAELVEAHPWLTDLPRPQKLRAMQDILSQAGVTVAPQAPASTSAAAPRQPSALPEAARAPVRQTAFIEPSNRGSAAESAAISPERQAYREKLAKYQEALSRPGGSDEAAKILASLGAGPVDETQMGYMHNRR